MPGYTLHIYVDYNYYSVPYEYVGKTVDVEITDNMIKVYWRQEQVAVHERIPDKGRFSTVTAHYPEFKVFAQDEAGDLYRDKMASLGPCCEKMFYNVIEKQPGHWVRTAKGILSLTNFYSQEIVEAARKRALAFGIVEYQAVQRICKNGAYTLPVSEVAL